MDWLSPCRREDRHHLHVPVSAFRADGIEQEHVEAKTAWRELTRKSQLLAQEAEMRAAQTQPV
jgi:hypothetical protein